MSNAVWSAMKGALTRDGQKYGATAHAVCTVQPVDGEAHFTQGNAGMSASASGQRVAKRGEISFEITLANRKSPSSEIGCVNSCYGGCCADLFYRRNRYCREQSLCKEPSYAQRRATGCQTAIPSPDSGSLR